MIEGSNLPQSLLQGEGGGIEGEAVAAVDARLGIGSRGGWSRCKRPARSVRLRLALLGSVALLAPTGAALAADEPAPPASTDSTPAVTQPAPDASPSPDPAPAGRHARTAPVATKSTSPASKPRSTRSTGGALRQTGGRSPRTTTVPTRTYNPVHVSPVTSTHTKTASTTASSGPRPKASGTATKAGRHRSRRHHAKRPHGERRRAVDRSAQPVRRPVEQPQTPSVADTVASFAAPDSSNSWPMRFVLGLFFVAALLLAAAALPPAVLPWSAIAIAFDRRRAGIAVYGISVLVVAGLAYAIALPA